MHLCQLLLQTLLLQPSHDFFELFVTTVRDAILPTAAIQSNDRQVKGTLRLLLLLLLLLMATAADATA
jgi:hypothetical protein